MHPSADTGRLIAGRYRLQAPIGRGAMGVVWHARDQLLDRDVAIKEVQIADTLTDDERATAYQRTLREAKTAARLNHPAVVTVYDVAEDGGRPWIVMQLVHAQSLDQVLAASGPLSPRRAAEIARQLLSALTMAHAAGVLHRDVKPSNVLIGSDDRAVLTDFGIATFQGDPKLTQTGMVMGSPGFTAPERIRGENASPASDLWSLGATIYAAVEGHGPYEKRGGAITTMSAIINEDPPEAPTAGALGPVIAALLRREPAERPDARAAARMITEVLPRLQDQPPGSPTGYQATALSASPRPASPRPASPQPASPQPASPRPASPHPWLAQPGLVRPRSPQPGETALDFDSAEQTIPKEPPGSAAASTSPPADPQASAEQAAPTAPTAPQPVQAETPRYGPSRGSWGQGAGAGSVAGASAGSAGRTEGPPPHDFSSWYDPSPRSGPAAQPGSGSAWSGSGSAWSGSGSAQPGSGRSGSGSAQPGSGRSGSAQAGSGRSGSAQPGSGRSGSAQAGSGRSGSGPAQPGYGPSPWPGSASQQAAGTQPWSGAGYEPDRRRRSGTWWKIAIAALAIIGAGAGAATVVLLHQSHSGSPRGGSTVPATGSTGSLPPPTLQIIDAVNMPASGSLPSGYTRTSRSAAAKETAGFSIAAPTSWKESTNGYQTFLKDPADPNTNILIDLTAHTFPTDMLKEAQYIESQSIPRFPGYQRVSLAAHTIRNAPGSYWKFTWMNGGVAQEAIDLLFVAQTPAGPQSYALYMTAPVAKFDQVRPIFDEEVETFATVPG